MNTTMRLAIPDHVLHQNLRGETILLDLDRGTYLGLDGVGTRFWEVIGECGEFTKAVDTILEEYQVERAELEADLMSLADELVESGLLVLSDTLD